MNVENYIKQHNCIHYCEAIIYPDGNIEDATPSHVYKLMSVTHKSKDELDKLIPDDAAPLNWLIGYTKCICVWYDSFMYDSQTNEQLNTIQELVNNNILRDGIKGYYTDEYTRCDLIHKYLIGEIRYEEIPMKTFNTIRIWRK